VVVVGSTGGIRFPTPLTASQTQWDDRVRPILKFGSQSLEPGTMTSLVFALLGTQPGLPISRAQSAEAFHSFIIHHRAFHFGRHGCNMTGTRRAGR
jgi:hypothetical protein